VCVIKISKNELKESGVVLFEIQSISIAREKKKGKQKFEFVVRTTTKKISNLDF